MNKKAKARAPRISVNVAAAHMEAAVCAWEHVIERLHVAKRDDSNRWDSYRASHGMCALRSSVMDLAPTVHDAYEIAVTAGFDAPFDWDFVPAFMERAVNDNCALRSDWRAIARAIGKEDK